MIVKVKQKSKRINGQLYRAREYMVHEHMAEMLSRVPEAFVVSSWRSLEEQKAMVAKGASKTLQSNHMRGVAVDVANWAEVQDKMNSIGLFNDIPWDRNHFTIGGERKAARTYPIIPSVSNPPYYKGKAQAPKIIIELPKIPKNMNISLYLNSAEWAGGKYEGKDFVVRLHQNRSIIDKLPRAQEFINSNFKNTWGVKKFQKTYERTLEWYARNRTVQETEVAFMADYKDWESKNPPKALISKDAKKVFVKIKKLSDRIIKDANTINNSI